MEIIPSLEEAEQLLRKYITDEYLLLHSRMVARLLKAYAKKFGQDENLWYITGLLHDLDYQLFPEQHPKKSIIWLKELKYNNQIIHAIEAHGIELPRILPETLLAKTLIATDEVSGLLYAYSLMRPSGFLGMNGKSALKKFKDKAFAAKIDRNEILYGVNELKIDIKEHLSFLISVLQ